MSLLASALAMSLRCKVRLLFSSAWIQARMVSSVMKMSQPFANNIGASAEIILTSGSAFMTFLIRATCRVRVSARWSLRRRYLQLTFDHCPVNVSGGGALPWEAICSGVSSVGLIVAHCFERT